MWKNGHGSWIGGEGKSDRNGNEWPQVQMLLLPAVFMYQPEGLFIIMPISMGIKFFR